ncbi:MAG: hypothetical protein QXQ19_02050, partial [Candidatus Aenigmatarchaeota archaeon]
RSPLKHFNIRIYPIYSDEDIPIIQNKPNEISEAELNQIWQKLLAIKVEIKEKEENKIEKENEEEKKFEKLKEKWRKKFLP